MKVYAYRDERWPDYGLDDATDQSFCVEIPDGLYRRYRAVRKQYDLMQDELEKVYNQQKQREKT